MTQIACIPLVGQVALMFATMVHAQPTYVDSSSGLETPRMESGRTEIEFADANGDGHPDLVCIGDHGSPFINTTEHGVMVWFGNGSGTWSVFQNGNFGYGGLGLGDVNGDGLLDIGYGMHHNYSGNDFGDQLLEVALGDGTGTNWTPWDDGLATNGETWGMFGVDLADVDNDGDLDIGSISFGCCAGLHVYLNNTDGTWVQGFGFLGGNSSQEFFFGDIDGDGDADFAASHGNGTVYLGDGRGGFTLADGNLPAPIWRSGVSLGDVNDDGRADLAFIRSGGLAVWTWTGFGTWQSLSSGLPTGGSFNATQIADMDLDGHGDLVAFSNAAIVVYRGDGAGNWQQMASVAAQPNTCGFAALRAGTDVDHNGFPDIGVVAEENCQPFVGGRNRPRVYKESSTPTAAWIYPKYPRGGEVFLGGSVQFVDWHAAVPGGATGSMTIELSRRGPAGPWQQVAAGLPNNGRFQWTLPTNIYSDDCRLRYTLSLAEGVVSAVTPGSFRIEGQLGDLDGDGDVDMADFLLFQLCYGGSSNPPALTCPPGVDADFDLDGDVDLADFLVLQQNFTGSG